MPTGQADSGARTPTDLLEELKAELESSLTLPDPRGPGLRKIRPRIDVSDSDFDEIVRDFESNPGWWVQNRLEHLARPMDSEFRDFLLDKESVLVAELNTGSVNACAIKAPNGGWLIALNRGLLSFFYGVTRALSTHMRVEGEPADIQPGSRAGVHMAVTYDWYVATGLAVGSEFAVTPLQLNLASQLATAAETFVLAHEIAHHYLGHVQVARLKTLRLGQHEVDVMETRREHEHEADIVGLRLVLEASRDGGELDPPIAYAGAELALRSLQVLDEYRGIPVPTTHPTSAERVRILREALQANVTPDEFSYLTDIADSFGEVFEVEAEHVVSRDRRQRALARRPEFEEFLGSLVDRYASENRDQHRQFYAEFLARQMDFHPEVICLAVATELEMAGEAAYGNDGHVADFQAMARLMLLLRFLGLHWLLRFAVSHRIDPELGEILRTADEEPETATSEPAGPSAG